jgi:hypothetical protein
LRPTPTRPATIRLGAGGQAANVAAWARAIGATSRTVDLASAHDIEHLGARRFAARLKALHPDLVFATEAERDAVPGVDVTWVIKLGSRGAVRRPYRCDAEPGVIRHPERVQRCGIIW